ncbi:MAG: hypothetical protein US68_C0022G0008 [Candidatus Shapirobacteria bacterium GW2011_GWE1_38_10]|uniref:Uncharacterized protein n=1 Tax=Candidatus Shapirobacteria bacterium GW2011_GWE1_38_10 TaxID=1618488 RepID=A0A0G0I0K7_9BACT|nr:MAG: hypothetical protein US68_C0022G0008 [Candidatus Shapirobacteria bacterium GW2011_GWE1_38_10]
MSGEFDKKHIIFQKEGSQYRIMIKSHGVFTIEKLKIIEAFKNKKSEKQYIKFALEQALGGCNYIVINKGKYYVQFWTSRGHLDYNFPMIRRSGNRPYYYQMIGLLAEMDFVRDSFVPSSIPTFTGVTKNFTYKVDKNDELSRITGYFCKRVDQATEFTLRMFNEIYKIKKGKLKIEVG